MKKFISLLVVVAFVAQSEASLKCFKIIKNNTDCIKELQDGGDAKLQPFTDVVTTNEAKLRNQTNWCTTQSKFLSFVVPDDALQTGATPPPARRRRTITQLSDCVGFFNYTIDTLANNDTANQVYNSYNQAAKTFVDQVKADLALTGNEEMTVIYDALYDAIIQINSASLNATSLSVLNETCVHLSTIASAFFNYTHCYECSLWGLDHQSEIRTYYGITTAGP